MFTKIFADTFSSLKHRNFRLFATGQFLSLAGSWAQGIALSWVAYEMTGTPVTLGVVAALSFGPLLLFGFFGGYIADKFPKYQTLLITQVLHSIFPFIVACLFFIDNVNINILYVCALVAGLLRMIDNPTRQAFRLFLISKDNTKNAISLMSSVNGFARIIGPLFAGFVLSVFGPAWCFLINTLSFWCVVWMMVRMDKSAFTKNENKEDGKKSNIKLSLKSIHQNKPLRDTLILAAILGILFLNSQVLYPIFTKEVFNLGSFYYAVIIATYSVGCIIGGLYAAQDKILSQEKLRRLGYFLATCFFFLSIPVSYALFLPLVFLTGFVAEQIVSSANSFIVLNSEDRYLGMATSLWSMAVVGTTAVGGLLIGYIAEIFGVQYFTFFSGVFLVLVILFWYKK